MNTLSEKTKQLKEILIVEDSKLQAAALKGILSREGYKVTAAQDGVHGLEELKQSHPCLIISDVWMPNMNGFEFCRAVKNDSNLYDIPFILLTSLSNTGDIIHGLNAGADYYITKPFNEKVLLSIVESILSPVPTRLMIDETQFVEIKWGGKTITVCTSSKRLLNFLFSTYENLLSQNKSLTQTKRELKQLNDNLEKRVREKTLSLERTLNSMVIALTTAIEMRDPYTAGHQKRVSRLAFAIAQELGFSADQAEGVRVMGFLHDIGKIIVPAEVLTKPSSLVDYELLFIKAHPKAGYDILKDISFPWPVAMAVFQHHERLDGSGYPAGLKDDEIVIEAKILAVADVIESMASHRPYRPALGIEMALNEIEKNKGVLYDYDAAAASLKLFREKSFTLQ